MRNDSEGYFRKLKAAGVPTEKIILAGQTHDTIAMRRVLSEGPDPASVLAQAIHSALSKP